MTPHTFADKCRPCNIEQYLQPARPAATNPRQWWWPNDRTETDGWMEMDGRTLDSFIEPAPYATRAGQQRERRKSKEDKVKRHLESRFCGTARNRSSTHAGAPCLLRFFRLGVNVDFALCSDPRLVRWRVVVRLHRIRVLDLTPSTKQKSVSSIEWEISISYKISDR